MKRAALILSVSPDDDGVGAFGRLKSLEHMGTSIRMLRREKYGL